MDYSPCDLKESDMIERLTLSLSDTCNYLLLHHLCSLSSRPKGISFAKTLSFFFFFFSTSSYTSTDGRDEARI